jgi:chromosome segregation ATPase
MSLLHQLKGIDEPLRAAMNRRDRLKRTVLKHANQVEVCTRKIAQAAETLERVRERTAEKISGLSDQLEMHEDYASKARTLYKAASKEVEKRLEEIGAL